MTVVTAALLERDGRILVCRRRADQKHPLKWEFPGGKVEPAENPVDGLRRELAEELGIVAGQVDEVTRFPFQYPGRRPILLIFYRVAGYSGEIQNRVFAELTWAKRQDLPGFDFLEGDVELVLQLASE